MNQEQNNFVDGVFTSASTSNLEVTNPSNQEVLGYIPETDSKEVDAAIDAARRAQPAWAALSAVERAGHLHRMAEAIRRNREELADTILREQGKVQALAMTEVDFTADYIDYMAEWGRRIEGEIIESDRSNENIMLFRKPLGVVAGILPWNFPFFLIARKMAPALITGNTVVIKPSEETPLNAFLFAKYISDIGLPPGVFNLVGGRGSSVGAQLSSSPNVDMVSFTGSVLTGTRIMSAASANLTKVNLELGGKAPAIVMDDADLGLAVSAIRDSRVINTGQVCNCAERVYVQRGVADEFIDKISKSMAATRFGDPGRTKDLDMGPLVSMRGLENVENAVAGAVAAGAEVVVGGSRADLDAGFHYLPTVMANCSTDMDIMQKETFGPVLPVQVFDSLDEAVALSNNSDYGLTSSVYTRNLSTAMRACKSLLFGETYVNRENFEAMQGFHAGWRKSGLGGADGKHGLYENTATQVVYLQY